MSDILIAPFTNSAIRDWPVAHYTRLVALLLDGLADGGLVRVVGTQGQRLRAGEIVRPYSAERVRNECGRLAWPALIAALRSAACVIGNNSGIGHLSGSFGTPTVSVFGGSHERREWRPRGRHVILVTRAIGCSPCQLDHGDSSPYDKACLREIEPHAVLDAARRVMARAAGADNGESDGCRSD